MKGFRHLTALSVLAFGGCASTGPAQYIYYPDLADKVLAGDAEAFRQVLVQAASTSPGERLEELAELSSRFVRIAPREFLQGQSTSKHCFGVSFMGPDYVDDPAAESRELALRQAALRAIDDPSLLAVRERCLADLAGG